MADFRYKLLGLAAFATLFAGVSFGQVSGCTVLTAAQGGSTDPGPSTMRAEGETELTGDIQFTCTSTLTTNAGLLELFMSAPVTSKVNALYTGYTEATLFICTGAPAVGPCTTAGDNTLASLTSGAVNVPTTVPNILVGAVQAYYGTASGNALTFSNIYLPTGAFTARVSNIRVNASAVTLTSTLTNVTAQVLFSGGGTSSSFSSALTAGYVLQSLQTTTLQPTPFGAASLTVTNYTTCGGNVLPPAGAVLPSFLVEIKSLFAGAFKKASGAAGAGENGTFIPGDGSTAGVATQPTQLQIVLGNVPAGVTIYAPTTVTQGTLLLTAITSAGTAIVASTTTGAPGALNAAAYQLAYPYSVAGNGEAIGASAAFTPTGGTVTIIYQVTNSDNTTASYNPDIPISYVFAANSFAAAQAATTVLSGYNPQATPAAITAIPTFAVQTATPVPATTIGLCQTTLLFPYVVNVLGFDTGIAISNTSSDPFGTTPAAGVCALSFYGTGAPTPSTGVNTANIPGGTVDAFLLSSVAPGFTGYVIAACGFNFGHAFAYIAYDLAQQNGATMGYLAEILTGPARPGNPGKNNIESDGN
jgi:hypothetical protein